MLNPWIIASLLFGAIGLAEEAGKKKPALPAPKKEGKDGSPVTVNVGQPVVESKASAKPVGKKKTDSGKVLTDKPTDG